MPGDQRDYPCRGPGCPVAPGGYDASPQPLGPDSLTWKLFGDWRGVLQGVWAGSMQNMHPQLGAAVEQHSIFFMERMPRLFRSLYPIGGVVFDTDRAPMTGAEVRDYHIGIRGVDDKGRRYSALNPDVFYWAHSTFFMGTILTAERFGDGLTEDPEAAVVRRTHHLVPDVRNEHAAGAQDLGGFSGLLGSHVPQRVREQLGRALGAGSVDHAQAPVAGVDTGPAVATAFEVRGTVLCLRDRRPLRPAGARTDGLHLVCSPGAPAPTVRQAGQLGVQAAAQAQADASAGTRRLGPGDRPGSLQTRRWCTPRPATCRQSVTATTECITARTSKRYSWSTTRRRNSGTGNGFADPGTSPAAPADSVRKPRAGRR